jgi:hypothetical protein
MKSVAAIQVRATAPDPSRSALDLRALVGALD